MGEQVREFNCLTDWLNGSMKDIQTYEDRTGRPERPRAPRYLSFDLPTYLPTYLTTCLHTCPLHYPECVIDKHTERRDLVAVATISHSRVVNAKG